MQSSLQSDIDHISMWSTPNLFQLYSIKCKEMIISFTQPPSIYEPVCMGNQLLKRVTSIKFPGVTLRNDLKWNDHLNIITSKASKHLYLLKHLKRADVAKVELVKFYCSCIKSVLGYTCQLFHSTLPLSSAELSRLFNSVKHRSINYDFKNVNKRDVLDYNE